MKLYEHQQRIIDDDPVKAGLWLGTGTGKTLTALLLARGSTLVIAPKTQVLDKNWEAEYEKLNLTFPLRVISKEQFKILKPTLPQYDTVIVDEAHYFGGIETKTRWIGPKGNKRQEPKTSDLYADLLDYIRIRPPKRLYLATATPIRSPMSVLALGRLLGRKWDFYEWRSAFYFPVQNFYLAKSDEATQERLARACSSLGYTGRLQDFMDVPEQTFKKIYVDITPEQKEALKQIRLEYPDPIVQIGKRHQIEAGVMTGNKFEDAKRIKNNKDQILLDLALEFPKLFIFARYKEQIKHYREMFEKEGYKVITFDGDTKDRGEARKEAEEAKACIFIAQTSVSSGYNLPSFPTMVFASLEYSIVHRVQGEGRILRANALKKNLYIDLITKGGIDEAVYKNISNKKSFNEKLYADENN